MEGESRPRPDAMLRRLKLEEEVVPQGRGLLKIFLGSAAGVGKTYRMLEEAQLLKKHDMDVVVAIVETHGRPETGALLEGLEVIPRQQIKHGEIVLEELDLDATLKRHPTLVLVDELAHTNAPGSRHEKRYRDVEELLEAGINVYSTLNIQHIESLNDIVYQITGVKVRETLPDRIVELANEIEVVDLSPEELLQRLKDGKVYFPPKAEQAMQRFFRKGNLLGLRELALRYAARKVDDDMRSYMEMHGIIGPWPAGSRLLVCISTSLLSERLLRTGQRMASDLDAEWFAVHVESPQEGPVSDAAKDQMSRNLRLARDLGAKVQVLIAQNIADEILAFAREHNVTLIIVGFPRRTLWNRWMRGSVVNEVIVHSGKIDVLVIGSTEEDQERRVQPQHSVNRSWRPFYGSLACVAATTGFCWLFQHWLGLINIAMLLLLPVVYSGMTWGRRSGWAASFLAVIALDYFFVLPQFTLVVENIRYLPMFGVFFVIGIVTSFLAEMVRWQGESARQRERFVSALYSFSRDLIAAGNLEELLSYAAQEISEAFECEVMILLPDENGNLMVRSQMGEHMIFDEKNRGVAVWVFQHGQPAGHGTETLSSSKLSYVPMKTKDITIGVLGIGLSKADQFLLPEQKRLLEAFASILALALFRITDSQ